MIAENYVVFDLCSFDTNTHDKNGGFAARGRYYWEMEDENVQNGDNNMDTLI